MKMLFVLLSLIVALPATAKTLALNCTLVSGDRNIYPGGINHVVGNKSAGSFKEGGHVYTYRVYRDEGALFADFNGVNDFAQYSCTFSYPEARVGQKFCEYVGWVNANQVCPFPSGLNGWPRPTSWR